MPNFLDLLRDNGIFSQDCGQANATMSSPPCTTQDTQLSALGTLAVVASNVSGVLIGVIYDRYGTMVTRLIISTSVIIGLLLVAFSPEVNWLLYPGMIFWFTGTTSAVIPNMALGQLFPSLQVLVMTWSYAVMFLSGVTFRVWRLMFEAGLSFRNICFINIAYMMVFNMRTFFLMPTDWITPENAAKGIINMTPFTGCRQLKKLWQPAEKRQHNHRQYIRQSLTHVFSLEYVLFVFWTVISFMGHINVSMTFLQYTQTITPNGFRKYIDFYGEMSLISAPIAILSALIIDFYVRWRHSALSVASQFRTKVKAIGLMAFLSVTMSSARTALQWTMEEEYINLSTVLTFIGVPMLMGQQSTFIRCNYPIEFFGVLSGLVRSMMSLSSCL